jgi:phage-related holin
LLKLVWFVSVLAVLANLLYMYASLPETVVIQEDEYVAIGREWLFYILMISIVVINALVYLVKAMFRHEESLRAWFHGLIVSINIFFIIAMNALNVYNTTDTFDQSLVMYYVTGSLALILVWAAIWPLYLVYQKIFIKQAI